MAGFTGLINPTIYFRHLLCGACCAAQSQVKHA